MDVAELPDASTLDEAAIAEHARERGCVLLRGWLDPSLTADLWAEVRSMAEEFAWIDGRRRALVPSPAYDDPAFIELQRRCFLSSAHAAVRTAPEMLRLARLLIGEDFCTHRGDLVRFAAPGSPPTPPHQDSVYTRESKRLWAVWTPLHPVPLSMGPLAVVPGSHRLGRLPHTGSPLPQVHDTEAMAWASAAMAPGDVLAVFGFTLHRALPNTATQARFSADFRYEPAADIPVEQRAEVHSG